jgi:hypothetical protein
MATQYANGKIVTSGLVLALDAADRNSYSGSGTTWNDMSGNNNNGTLINGPTFSSANGGSIIFDGIDDYINCGNNTILNLNDNYTISIWLKTSTLINQAIIQRYLNGGAYPGYSIDINRTTTGTIDIYTGGNWYINNGSNINNNTWNHIVFTINLTTATFYKNTNSTSFSVVASTTNPNDTLFIGCLEGNTGFFSGNIAQTLIYNRALSAQEVLQNYNAQKSRFNL